MNKYPSVKYRINENLDIQIGAKFLDIKKGGIDFGANVI